MNDETIFNADTDNKCIHCDEKFHFMGAGHDAALKHGDIYSQDGINEARISGYCEYCFDDLFDDEED